MDSSISRVRGFSFFRPLALGKATDDFKAIIFLYLAITFMGPAKAKPSSKAAQPKRAPRSKKASKPRNPGQRSPKLAVAKIPRSVRCPSLNGLPFFSYPVVYKSSAFSIAANSSAIAVIAPFNDCLGAVFSQAATPPDTTTAVAQTYIIDPYLTSLLTPPSITGSTNSLCVRWTSFCVEVLVSDALASVNNTVQLVRWVQNGVPVCAAGTPASFQNTYSSLQEHNRLVEQPAAAFTSAKCFRSGMLDRSALEFTAVATSHTPWFSVYGNTGASTTIGSFNPPWSPLVLSITGASALNLKLVIRGNVEVIPPMASFLARLAKPRPDSPPGAEEAWWRMQRRILAEHLTPVGDTRNRRAGPYIGM